MAVNIIPIRDLKQGNLARNVTSVIEKIKFFQDNQTRDILQYNVKLVIWELFCNFIQHGADDEQKHADVEILEDEEKITVRITSFGKGFYWIIYRNMECPVHSHIGGRGLYLIQQVCDFSYDEDGKVATAIFYL